MTNLREFRVGTNTGNTLVAGAVALGSARLLALGFGKVGVRTFGGLERVPESTRHLKAHQFWSGFSARGLLVGDPLHGA
jgi:hypothetical protein